MSHKENASSPDKPHAARVTRRRSSTSSHSRGDGEATPEAVAAVEPLQVRNPRVRQPWCHETSGPQRRTTRAPKKARPETWGCKPGCRGVCLRLMLRLAS